MHDINPFFNRMGEENAFAVLARATQLAAEGRDIINLGIGQPDFATPAHIVEAAVKAAGDPYTPNNARLDGSGSDCARLAIVTGPNMAGKSTYLRTVALCALLHQIGSFVPADRAELPVYDTIHTRIGASDDLAGGRSTFMVEMSETANILHNASDRSLVLMDEVGRGTSTFDGLSLAWAAAEQLARLRAFTLFATHYHELTALSAKLPRMFNATVRVKEWQGDVVFLHEVLPGSADRSYGIQVAKLAGLPPAVITRAKSVLAKLEAQDRGQTARAVAGDLPLFAVPSRAAAEDKPPSEAELLVEAVKALHPDEMSPREALDALYALRAKLPKQ